MCSSDLLLAAVEAAQPFKVDLAKGTFAANNPAAAAIRARLGELPLAWIEPYEKRARLAGAVSGGAVEITVRTVDDLTIAATAPLGLRNATVSWNNQALVQNLDMTADFSATKRKDQITYDVRRLEAKQGEAALLRFNATVSLTPGDKLVGAAKGMLEVPDAGARLEDAAALKAKAAQLAARVAPRPVQRRPGGAGRWRDRGVQLQGRHATAGSALSGHRARGLVAHG